MHAYRRVAAWAGRAAMLVLTGFVCANSAQATATADASCDVLAARVTARRPPTADDLLRLRDIGRSGGSSSESPFGVSPDGHTIAFLLREADPASNSYCQGLVTKSTHAGAAPVVIDRGGELIRYTFDDLRGVIFPTGTPAIVTPVWSPEGTRIAYLRRVGGRTIVRIVPADGATDGRTIKLEDDVDAVKWLDADHLIVQIRPGLKRANAAIRQEGRSGYLFDDRFAPIAQARPFPRGPVEPHFLTYDLSTDSVRSAGKDEARVIAPEKAGKRPPRAILFDRSKYGGIAWTVPRYPPTYGSPVDLYVEYRGKPPARCAAASCSRVNDLWWVGGDLLFMRREGWGNSMTGLYRLSPNSPRPQRLFTTADAIVGCQRLGSDLLCARESSLQPRRVVLIDGRTGHERMLFDPNPNFASLQLGMVERLHWRNARGIESYGDLVLPPNHRPGERHPLIVVQYRTRGFLRGGTGDEYPIQAFAARGYAVLSIERPPSVADEKPDPRWRTPLDAEPTNVRGWADRRNILSTMVTGVNLVVARGLVEPGKIGLTGMSDGATTAQFALINTSLFAAASLSSCCEDPKTEMIISGPAVLKEFKDRGYPASTNENPQFWKPFSLAVNAATIGPPILMQLSDDEYQLGLEAFTALREHGKPVEMYVFPNERHVKWQPSHRAAIYARNLDWFDYWLRDQRDPDPVKAEQYARWSKLRSDQTDQTQP